MVCAGKQPLSESDKLSARGMLEAIGEDNVCSISPDELQIYRHPDGREWVLGRGSFGEVGLLSLHCFTRPITP